MNNFLDYLKWRGDLSFEKSPFNKIDALILSQISYLNFKGLIPESFNESILISDFSEMFDSRFEKKLKKYLGTLINQETYDLLVECSRSERFGSLKLCGFRDFYSKKKCEQFAAFTVVNKDWNCVCFRGTDNTIIGWKEDFYLGCVDETFSQKDAVEYFTDATESCKGNFYIAGHSKGGNEALYTAVNSSSKDKKRILKVFNFDGPGLPLKVLNSKEFAQVADRIESVYPECSIVGMIFYHPEKIEIVESSQFLVMQHDAFSWNILGTDFIRKENFEDESVFFHATFNEFYENLTWEEMKLITDKMFGILLSTGCKTLDELDDDKIQNSLKIISELTKLDKADRHEIKKLSNIFIKAGKGNFPLFNSFKFSMNKINGQQNQEDD